VFQNGVPRKIFGPKRHEGVGGWRRLCYEELHNVFFLPNFIKVMK
jgi:hypothetical protein